MRKERDMTEKDFVTVETLQLREENLTLKFTAKVSGMLDEKFSALETRLDESNITRRDRVIEEVTGFTYENRAEIKKTIQHSHADMVASEDTNNKMKTALINYGVPVSIATIAGYLAGHWPWSQ